MSNELARFSVAMPEDLLMRFDGFVARRGLAKNRSEVVRDLVREALIAEEAELPGTEVMGTLTIVFNHHSHDVQEKLHHIQHAHYTEVVSTTHVHLDEDNCLEVIILRGEGTYQVDGEQFPVSEGTIVRVSPDGRRALKNTGRENLTMLCIQYRANNFTEADSPMTDGNILADPLVW